MSFESATCATTPPRVTGDVDIARFPSGVDRGDRWRVSIGGRLHFLTDVMTAHRIFALSSPWAGAMSYELAYRRYGELAGTDAESFDAFVAWSERHRTKLEGLAETPDDHPLKMRRRLINEGVCQAIARHLVWLFHRLPMTIFALSSSAIVVLYMIAAPAHWQGTFPIAMLLALLGIFVHEIGHITGCVRHGARQGGIGIGLYWIWPAFYADVRGSWSLTARNRLQVSTGGIYFQSIYAAVLAGLCLTTGNQTFGMAVHITLLLMATTCNPVFKYDGYWILTDLLNVINVHTRIAEHLKAIFHAPRNSRWAFFCSRWTLVSIVFACAATAYIAYIAIELILSASEALQHLVGNWRSLNAEAPVGRSVHLWISSLSLLTQLVLIGLALVILGARALHATAAVIQGKRKE